MAGDGSISSNFPLKPAGADPPKKRIRKSRSRGLRTKSGCLTCRKRHKKCDEIVTPAPICGPCSISNRDCVYGNFDSPAHAVEPRASRASFSSETGTNICTPIPHKAGSQVRSALEPGSRASFSSAADTPRPLSLAPLSETVSYSYSRKSSDTVSSEILSTDRASTKWLDLLATDAAHADSSFCLAPSPVPEDSVSNVGYEERRLSYAESQSGLSAQPSARSVVEIPTERHPWQLNQDIVLQDREVVLFRMFTERASLWLDVFDPVKHFSTYAVRLALRNIGLMKAILALTARHSAMVQATKGAIAGADFSEAVQYYYETLHYVQKSLHYHSYTHSEELLATALIISTYEMLDKSSNWKRHLKGVFWIQRSQNVNAVSGGLRQSVWWAWLRQDIWAAYSEKRACFSFWRPVKDYPELNQDEVADRAIYLLSQAVNYCAKLEDPFLPMAEVIEKRTKAADVLMAMLDRWLTFCGTNFRPLPSVPSNPNSVFRPIWIHPGKYAVSIQLHSLSRILITLHRPTFSDLEGCPETQRMLSDAVATICGIAMELKDEGCLVVSAHCLFGAGLCVKDEIRQKEIVSLINETESRTGWPMETLRNDLRVEWAKTR